MISVSEAIQAGHSIVLTTAINQRKQRRHEITITLERWRKSFMANSIKETRVQIEQLERRLATELRQERNKEEMFSRMNRQRQKMTKEIATLRLHLPLDPIGKLAKKFVDSGLPEETVRRLIGEILNARKETPTD